MMNKTKSLGILLAATLLYVVWLNPSTAGPIPQLLKPALAQDVSTIVKKGLPAYITMPTANSGGNKSTMIGGKNASTNTLQLNAKLQKAFQNDIRIDITLVSRDNFFLFTPMLPEVSSGMIETRHIVTPLRAFCNRAKFYETELESIDLENKKVVITHRIGKHTNPIEWRSHMLKYDYLVIALGSETNFFGISEATKHAFTLKSLGDAIVLRNHVINMLEQADIEHEDPNITKRLLTFVVVGGGFSGVEIVGELNDFILDSIKY